MSADPVARLYLIRHAKAASRDRWEGPDAARPLTDRGRRQAAAIGAAIAKRDGTHISRLVTSPALRCRDTMAPLACSLGLELEEAEWLLEGADPPAALGRLGRLAGALGIPPVAGARSDCSGAVVACTHGDIMWAVLDYLARRGVDLGPDPGAPKGAVWVLDYDGTEVSRAELLLPGGEEK